MAVLLVTYNISPKKRDYTPLYEAIKGHPASTWWHYLDSTWLVKTTETPRQMSDRLKPHIDSKNDSLLIVKTRISQGTTEKPAGWLPREAWDWINEKQ